MKKKELGITKGEVTPICVTTNAGSFYKVTGESESVCNVTTRNGERACSNATLIADAFNSANKCGLLPSELLEWKHETLMLLKEIENDTERRYRFTSGANWPKWYNKAINQIEQ